MSVGKNSISRISTASTTKKAPAKKPVEKVDTVEAAVEVVPAEEVKAAPTKAPAKKPAAKKAAPKKAKSNAFKIYQVSDELPYYLL